MLTAPNSAQPWHRPVEYRRIGITRDCYLNVVLDHSDVAESTMGVRVYVRSVHGRFKAKSPTAYFPTALGYPDSYRRLKTGRKHLICLIGYSEGRQNEYSNLWLLNTHTGRLKLVESNALGLDVVDVHRGLFTESAGAQYIGGLHQEGQAIRALRLDYSLWRMHFGPWHVSP